MFHAIEAHTNAHMNKFWSVTWMELAKRKICFMGQEWFNITGDLQDPDMEGINIQNNLITTNL